MVHEFAEKYFNLPKERRSIIGDAITVVDRLQLEQVTYEYIIHDVFTGGVEPVELFTEDFLNGLSNLLSPEGVVAIVSHLIFVEICGGLARAYKGQNYAGDLLLPSAASVVHTVMSVFPNCRLFREVPAAAVPGAKDYTNMVMFCKKSHAPLIFRDPVEDDFLGSPARRQYLKPQYETNSSYFHRGSDRGRDRILKRGQEGNLRASQLDSAAGHWYVMRSVLPDLVWNNW